MKMTVGARELKYRLGTYLRMVREGATIVVTDRGRPVAELRGLGQADGDEEERLGRLVASGLLVPRRRADLSAHRRVRVRGAAVSDTVIAERGDRL